MISKRTVTYLGTITLLTAITAGLAAVDRLSQTRTTVDAEAVYPDFSRRADEVYQIQVIRAEDNEDGSASLVRSGDGWILEQRDGYPARTDAIRKLLFDIGELELIERKTADPGRFDRLHLRDVAQAGSEASRLVMTTASGETLVDLHIGKRRDSLSGGDPMVYVRRTDDTQTYLAEGDLDLRGRAPLWLFRSVVDVPQADVRKAVLVTEAGDRTTLERIADDGRDFRIVGLPEGRKIDSQYQVNNAATVLDKLVFDDVRSTDGLRFDPALGHAEFTTQFGTIYTVDFASEATDDTNGVRWIRLSVTVPEGAADDVRQKAVTDRERTQGWAFRISDWEMERMTATVDGLTEPVEGS